MDNILNARLQHAVEHTENNTQIPAPSSVPLNGEIVFNSDRTNFKVGNGNDSYSQLTNAIHKNKTLFYTIPSDAQSLSVCDFLIYDILYTVESSVPQESFDINEYNHILIYDPYSKTSNGDYVEAGAIGYDVFGNESFVISIFTYLKNHKNKPLRISFSTIRNTANDNFIVWFENNGSNTDTTWTQRFINISDKNTIIPYIYNKNQSNKYVGFKKEMTVNSIINNTFIYGASLEITCIDTVSENNTEYGIYTIR